MQKERLAFPIDWIVIVIRLLFLGGIAVWLVFNLGLNWPVNVAVLMAILATGNGLALAVVGQSQREAILRITSVIGDTLFALLLIYSSRNLPVDLSAAGLLPLISASIYFSWIGAVVLTGVNTLFQGWVALSMARLDSALISAVLVLVIYLGIGLAIAYTHYRLYQLRPARSETVQVRPESERERQRLIYNLISSLSSSLNYERVLETALDLSTSTLAQLNAPAEKLKSAVLLFQQGKNPTPELNVAAARRFLPSDARLCIPGEHGLIGRAIETSQPRVSRDIRKDAELNHFIALHECQSAYCIPLRAGLETFGILLFAHPHPDFFDAERREVLDIVGNQSVIALQNARLYRDLEQEKERMMEIQEDARKKIARDLHDGPTQSIAAIAMRVNFARRLMERDAKAAAEELFKIEDMARRTTKEIRHMLFTLRPLVLESQGLVAALESMVEKMRETYNQELSIQADARVVELLEMTKQAIVFYIAEEAIANARKHAQASHIWVRMKMLKDELCLLEIEDDGIGFDVSSIDATYHERGSLGMVNMRERSELVNGVLHIESTPGEGACVQLVIPLTEEAADHLRRLV